MAVKSYIDRIRLLGLSIGGNRVKEDHFLKETLVLDLDIKTEGLLVVNSEPELVKVFDLCQELKIPVSVVSSGFKLKPGKKVIPGLMVVDKTNLVKIVGIKGKVGGEGIGVEAASVEASSGLALFKLNAFLDQSGLEMVEVLDNPNLSLTERFDWDNNLRSLIEKIKIWDHGQVYKADLYEFNSNRHKLLALTIKIGAKRSF